jgi:hypothetical protein
MSARVFLYDATMEKPAGFYTYGIRNVFDVRTNKKQIRPVRLEDSNPNQRKHWVPGCLEKGSVSAPIGRELDANKKLRRAMKHHRAGAETMVNYRSLMNSRCSGNFGDGDDGE